MPYSKGFDKFRSGILVLRLAFQDNFRFLFHSDCYGTQLLSRPFTPSDGVGFRYKIVGVNMCIGYSFGEDEASHRKARCVGLYWYNSEKWVKGRVVKNLII